MKIGVFQLQNLLAQQVKFVYLHLTDSLQAEQPSLLAGAQPVAAGEVLDFVRKNQAPPDAPIVLICADGRVSGKVAGELEAAAFMNVFYIEGGVAALPKD